MKNNEDIIDKQCYRSLKLYGFTIIFFFSENNLYVKTIYQILDKITRLNTDIFNTLLLLFG